MLLQGHRCSRGNPRRNRSSQPRVRRERPLGRPSRGARNMAGPGNGCRRPGLHGVFGADLKPWPALRPQRPPPLSGGPWQRARRLCCCGIPAGRRIPLLSRRSRRLRCGEPRWWVRNDPGACCPRRDRGAVPDGPRRSHRWPRVRQRQRSLEARALVKRFVDVSWRRGAGRAAELKLSGGGRDAAERGRKRRTRLSANRPPLSSHTAFTQLHDIPAHRMAGLRHAPRTAAGGRSVAPPGPWPTGISSSSAIGQSCGTHLESADQLSKQPAPPQFLPYPSTPCYNSARRRPS